MPVTHRPRSRRRRAFSLGLTATVALATLSGGCAATDTDAAPTFRDHPHSQHAQHAQHPGRQPGHRSGRQGGDVRSPHYPVSTGTFWVSSPTDASRRLLVEPAAAGPSTATVSVDPGDARQTWWGTGAALTDASVGLLRDRPDALRALYGAYVSDGARLSMLRLPLSATDFSPEPWSWAWDGTRPSPPSQEIAAVDLLRGQILGLRPGLKVVTAPWTAPATMKSNHSLRGGSLAAGSETAYADLLAAQNTWLKSQGVPVFAATAGNEPEWSSDYPSMRMSDDQLVQVGRAAGPRLHTLGVRLWALDHNWSDQAHAAASLQGAPAAYDGVAYHCYGGRPDAMAADPVPRMVTECTGTTDGWSGTFAWDARNLVADAVASGSSGLMMWNLALDAAHGPVDTGSTYGCKNCRGLLTVTPDGVTREPEFYTLAHLSRAATPGARVVSSTSTPGLAVATFRNEDGSIGVFGHNATGAEQVVRIEVKGGATVSYRVRAGELFTYRSR